MWVQYFFGMRAGFGLDTCCLFPQRVLAVIPLIGGVQVPGPCTLPGRWGQWLVPGCSTLGGRPHSSQEGGGSDQCPLAGCSAVVAVHAHLWSPRWQRWLVLIPGARVGGALPPNSMCGERNSYSGTAPCLACPPTMEACLSGRPWLLSVLPWSWPTTP